MKNLKEIRLPGMIVPAVLIAFIFALSGCGGNIDDDVLESNRVVNRETSAGDDVTGRHTDDTDNGTTEPGSEDETTTDDNGEDRTSQPETTKVPETTVKEEPPKPPQTTTQTVTTTQQVTAPPTTQKPKPPYTVSINNPVASGTAVSQKNGYIIDYSNASQGYVMINGSTSQNVYIQVYRDSTAGGNLLDQGKYAASGQYITVPLSYGSGKYIIIVANSSGVVQCSAEVNAGIPDAGRTFVYPNYRVSFTAGSSAVNKAYEICAGAGSSAEKVRIVKQYVMNTLTYNWDLAGQVSAGSLKSYTPNADNAIATGKGICCDYACLFATMLRCQGIPVKMIYGYVPKNGGTVYHAWNEAYYDGSWHRIDCTYEDDGGSQAASYSNHRIY